MVRQMYKLSYLSNVFIELEQILSYIRYELDSPQAAENLLLAFQSATESLTQFPYANQAYIPLIDTGKSYRRKIIKNYLLFYHVDEDEQVVTIVKIKHARQDYTA